MNATIEKVDTANIAGLIDRGIVPIVAGFQGYYYDESTGRDEVSVLGRGGSNLTAVALAAALGQPEATMCTDVDGLYDADPKRDENAQRIAEVTGAELLGWDQFPTVIQRASVEYAIEQQVDIIIRSGFESDLPGTRIICRP